MNPTITIALFPTRSRLGRELQESFCTLAQNHFNLQVTVYQNASQLDLGLATINHDLVILDATIETDYRDSNYSFFIESTKALEHVLVVSRSYLPINFFGFDESGAPVYPDSKTNSDILQWLKTRLENMLPSLPREKSIITDLKTQSDECWRITKELVQKGVEQKRKIRRDQGQIFISYRNKYNDQVNELKMRIEAGEYHQGVKKSVIVIPAGSLVYENEILTSQRRWGVVSKTDRMIIEAEEMWVYYTLDYFDSWWTQGELVTLHHRNQNRTEKTKLHIYDPLQNSIRYNLAPSFTFELDERQQERMARWYSNSDDMMEGPEAVKRMRRLQFWVNLLPPDWLDRYFALVYKTAEAQNLLTTITDDAEETGQILKQYQDREWRKEYFNDDVWSKEFWEYPLIKCIYPAAIDGKMDMNDFLFTKRPLHVRLSPRQLEKAVRNKEIRCPGCEDCPDRTCRAVFKIDEGKPRYLWMTTQLGFIKSGDHGSGLRKLPVYRAEHIK